MNKNLTANLVKAIAFTVVTVLATAALAATIRNGSSGAGREYQALFTNATSLSKGDDIRMAGVKIGTVSKVEVGQKRLAEVTFSVSNQVNLRAGTTAEMRFRNLVGQRYISLQPADLPGAPLKAGYTFGLSQTKPALDLTLLFNGFQPLLRMLNPTDVNNLSAEIIAVFQGEGATVDGLLSSTASLTSTLASKDAVIGELITNLNSVLTTVNSRSSQLDTTIVTLQQLVSGLSEDRKTIGSTLDGLGQLTTSVAGLLEQGRAPLKGSITALDGLAGNLAAANSAANGKKLDTFFKNLPTKLGAIGRLGSYGSWLNFYVCSLQGGIPMPGGYTGDLGVKPTGAAAIGRCQS